ncbi:hypothetical protein AHF37_09440 [Paragonimus kellicotti]|nr:hypothetical protein AHF37_09440 [Paragonimus kellicotti]
MRGFHLNPPHRARSLRTNHPLTLYSFTIISYYCHRLFLLFPLLLLLFSLSPIRNGCGLNCTLPYLTITWCSRLRHSNVVTFNRHPCNTHSPFQRFTRLRRTVGSPTSAEKLMSPGDRRLKENTDLFQNSLMRGTLTSTVRSTLQKTSVTTAMFDIETLRKVHENPTEWRIRREFLLKNKDVLDPERLECLSHCFINTELYGNAYPDKVMQQVKEYGAGILQSVFPTNDS